MATPRPDAERVWLALFGHALAGVLTHQPNGAGEGRLDWHEIDKRLVGDAAQAADLALDEWRRRYEE